MIEWFAALAEHAIERALVRGINKTTSDGAILAKRLVNKDTTTLQGSIYPEAAKINSDGQVEGLYGPHDISYAALQEFLLGEWMPDSDGDGETLRQRNGGKPYMRPSYENAKLNLMQNIKDSCWWDK